MELVLVKAVREVLEDIVEYDSDDLFLRGEGQGTIHYSSLCQFERWTRERVLLKYSGRMN